MEENDYNLGTREDVGDLYSAGIGYVIIPPDTDRTKYITECYKFSTVSIISEFNGVSNRVPIDSFSLNFIQFPDDVNKFGSAVSFLLDPVHKKPIIVGIYKKQDERNDLKEHQFKFKRDFNGNVVEITGSPDGKYLALNVSADSGGEVSINLKSKDESGKVSINVDGDCLINSLSDTTIRQYGKLTLETFDRGNDEEKTIEEHTSEGRSIYSKNERLLTENLLINDGKENFILGQLFKAYVKELVTEIANATVSTSIGQQPLINKLEILEFAKDIKIDEFLSKIAFIDK